MSDPIVGLVAFAGLALFLLGVVVGFSSAFVVLYYVAQASGRIERAIEEAAAAACAVQGPAIGGSSGGLTRES